MNPLETRRREDLRRVRAVCAASDGKLVFISADSEVPTEIRLRLMHRVALDGSYPQRAGQSVDLRIVLPAGYPFRDPPRSWLSPAVWHPNVFADGTVCQGRKWMVSEYLDLYVRRMVRIATYQSDVTNLDSVANPAAAAWYRAALQRSPAAFPTDTVEAVSRANGSIAWKDAT